MTIFGMDFEYEESLKIKKAAVDYLLGLEEKYGYGGLTLSDENYY